MSRPAENEIVQLLRQRFGGRAAFLEKGIGDDAAVIRPARAGEFWLLTTDLLLEGVHFRREWLTPRQLGQKALAVNLSDIAAMGGKPRLYLVALGVPRGLRERWIVSLYEGMARLGKRYRVSLAGGDLSRSVSGIHISLTVLGQSIKGKIVYRSWGKPGDLLYVTGVLGKSAAGLALLRSGKKPGRSAAERAALKAHLEPEPRCAAGLWLAEKGYPRAMMDLSDGLSADLPRMCRESRTGAEIWGFRLPLFPDSSDWSCDPLDLALHGGEDYELLFAVPRQRVAALESSYPPAFPRISRIGTLTGRRAVEWLPAPGATPRPLPPRGFDHFRATFPS